MKLTFSIGLKKEAMLSHVVNLEKRPFKPSPTLPELSERSSQAGKYLGRYSAILGRSNFINEGGYKLRQG